MHIALKLIDLKNNDEVLIPSLNFIASTNATLYCGGIPHFVEIEEKSLGVDIDKLDEYLKTPAVHIHLYGKTEARTGRKMGHVNILKKENK